MKIRLYPCLTMLLVVLCFTGNAAQADYVSTFDSTSELWRMAGDYTSFGFNASEGSPTGAISYVDQATGAENYFVSPLSWAGNWSAYKNGTLQYDIKLLSGNANNFYTSNDVVIRGPGIYLSKQFITAAPVGWAHYTVPLTAAAFGATEADFDRLLARVDSVDIRGEFIIGAESEALDNVRVTAVPLPGSLWLLAFGLPAVMARRQKFGR